MVPLNSMKSSKTDSIDLQSDVFLGRLCDQLSGLIESQVRNVFEENEIVVPVKSCSVLVAIKALGKASPAELARYLNYSHQLVTQKLPRLVALGLLKRKKNRQDGRQNLFSLTPLGESQLIRLQGCTKCIMTAYEDLFAEVGNLSATLKKAIKSLEETPIGQRLGKG